MFVGYELDVIAACKVRELEMALARLKSSRKRHQEAKKSANLGNPYDNLFDAELQLEKAATQLKKLLQ